VQDRLKPEVARFFSETTQLGLGCLETATRLTSAFPIVDLRADPPILVAERLQCGKGIG